jgi:group I intron endonuclease
MYSSDLVFGFVTAAIYPNAEIEKPNVLRANKGKSGIYRGQLRSRLRLPNLKNNKTYVGSSVCLDKRLNSYYSISYLQMKTKINNSRIYKALLKHRNSNFSLEILEYCKPKDVIKREQFYLNILKPDYNILKTAGSSLGYKHLQETKAKISASLKGKTYSEKTLIRMRMSEAVSKKGENHPLFGKTRSEETKTKISEALKGKAQHNSIKILVTDLETNVSTAYESMSQEARALNIQKSSIQNYFSLTK